MARAGLLLREEHDPMKARPLAEALASYEATLATEMDDFLQHCRPGGAKDMGFGGSNATAPGNVEMLAEAFAPLQHYRGIKSGPELATAASQVLQRIAWCLLHAGEIEVASTQQKHLSDLEKGSSETD